MPPGSTPAAPPRLPLRPAVESSRTAANLLKALARAYPNGAPAELKATADHVWELASRAATLEGAIESFERKIDRLADAVGAMRVQIVGKIDALAGDDSPTAREQLEQLRKDLGAYDQAHEQDAQAGRDRIAARVQEARACEEAFLEGCAKLVEHLRGKPECRDVLEEVTREVYGAGPAAFSAVTSDAERARR